MRTVVVVMQHLHHHCLSSRRTSILFSDPYQQQQQLHNDGSSSAVVVPRCSKVIVPLAFLIKIGVSGHHMHQMTRVIFSSGISFFLRVNPLQIFFHFPPFRLLCLPYT